MMPSTLNRTEIGWCYGQRYSLRYARICDELLCDPQARVWWLSTFGQDGTEYHQGNFPTKREAMEYLKELAGRK